MDRYLLNAVTFSEGQVSISFMDTHKDLREGGDIYTTHNVSLGARNRRLWAQATDIKGEILELLEDVLEMYRTDAPWLPDENADTDDSDEEEYMGSAWRQTSE